MCRFRVGNAATLIQKIPSLDPGFLELSEFRGIGCVESLSVLLIDFILDFYHFVFQFSREGTHRTIGN